jgi:hypothetical protein
MLPFKVTKTGGKGCAGDSKGGGLGGVAWVEWGEGDGEVLLVAVLGAAMGLIIGKCLRGGWGGLVGGVWEVVGLPVIVVVEAVDVLVASFVLFRHTCGVCACLCLRVYIYALYIYIGPVCVCVCVCVCVF